MAARILVVSLALLALVPGGCGEANCPFVCFCFPNLDEDSTTLTVDCRNQDLKEIPLNLPNTTSHLDVSNNQIQFIRIGDLSGLESLTYLQLQNNELTAIQGGAFREVPNLERLTLFNNRILELREGTFEGLTRLQSLIAYNIQLERYDVGVFDELRNIIQIDLSFNNLEVIPTDSFTALTRLTRLLLNDNFIQEIEMGAIQNLPFLQYLNLANNQLRSITPMAFIDLPFLRTLSLQGNPLECGCDAIWLFDFLTAQSLMGPTCEEPPSLAGRNLLDLQLAEFCALPTAVITEPDAVLAEGMPLQLTCNTTGAPPPAVFWSRDGMTFDPMDARINILGESLQISDVFVNDTGTYYCTATSTTGTVATSTMVTVLDVAMENMVDPFIGSLGQTAELNCSSSLPPGVPVQWEIDSVPLSSSDKYIITPSGSLLVMDLQLSDMTNYTCRVNGLSLTRELILQAEPQIVEFPEGPCDMPDIIERTTERPVILTCSAFGIPPPSVQWLFQGMIEASEVSTTGGTTTAQLVRSPALEEHSGNYTCLASNELGSVNRTVQLELQILVVVNETATTSRMVLEGATLVLPCSVQNRNLEGATVTWMRMDGIPLSEKIVITSDFTLIIPNATQPDDIGVYMCTVVINGFSTFISFGVIIFSPPMIQTRCDLPTTQRVVDDTVCLLCNASGNPFPAITWDRDGVTVEASDRVQFFEDDTKLQIERLVEEDGGLYTCTATADSDLLPGDMLLDLGNDTGSQLLVVLPPSVRPFFRLRPGNVQVPVGDVIQVLCSGGGNPQPTLTWWRELDPFTSGNATQVMPDLRTIISDEALVILDAVVEDDGRYYCNLSSPLMEVVSPDVIIRVWVPPAIPPLANEFIKLDGASNVTLPCNGTGDPSPVVIWMRGSEVLTIPGERYLQEPAGHLVILRVGEDDAGVYTCRVANVAGDDFHQVNLIVRTLADVQVEPVSVRANVGCQVSFFCSDGGSIPEEFEWQFDGEPLESGGNVLVRPTGELVLSDLMIADSGNYTCAIWGPLGAAENSTTLIVEDPLFASGADVSPPSVSSPTPGLQQVPEGQTAQFICLASGFPEPTIEWFRNGEPLPNLQRIVVEGGFLTIENLRTTDSASYTCTATNVFETVMMTFDLTVSVAPQFWIRPTPTEVIEHETIVLECKAVGVPRPTITWVHEEQTNGELIPGGRVIINTTVDTSLNGTKSLLQIFNSTLADSGTYTCVARNSAGMTQYGVPVEVSLFQSAPNVTVLPGSVTLISGSSLILDCETTGIPAPLTMWLKDGVPLPVNQSSCSDTLFDCVDDRSVIITSADVGDSGRYTCIAENAAGREAYEVFVTVTTADTLPFFTILPSPAWVQIGSDIAIDCQAEGTPPPNITWLIGFDPINESDWIMVLDNGTLVILDAQEEDAGLYTCRASSEGGVNQVIISVDVGNLTNVSRPDLISFPVGTLRVSPDETVVLDCVANGHPPPTISWLRDGEEILNQFSNIRQESNGSLVLENVTESENGNYTCRAVNSAGSAEVHVRLEVIAGGAIGVGRAPQFTVLPKDVGILAGSEVRVDCQAEGLPHPFISWTHNGSSRPVYEDELVSVATNGSLLFYSVQMSQAGSYTCHASNIRGVIEKDVVLEVWSRKEPPYFLEWPQSSQVVVDSNLLLHCLAASTMDTPTIQWAFNGQKLVMQPDGRKEILSNGSLSIESSQLHDSGNYTCIASNRCGSVNATALVTILKLPLDFSHTAVVRSGYQMSCSSERVGSVVGEGGGRVVWRREGQVVAGSRRVLVFQGLLIFLGVRVEDEGEYTCSTTTDQFNHFLEVQVPPSILQASTLVQARSGNTAALHCLTGGKPTPLVAWQHDDLVLERDDKFSILSNGTLLLYRSSGNDAGMYLCRASNGAGSVEQPVFLVVTKSGI